GATVTDEGVNFSVFSKHSSGMDLVLFPSSTTEPIRIIPLDESKNRTYSYWHAFVPGLKEGQCYGFRAHGQMDPSQGRRYDPEKVLLDPYARAISGWDRYDRKRAAAPGDNSDSSLKSVVLDHCEYDWEGDAPLRTPFAESVIYEMHVGGFTRSPSSGVAKEKRGTFAGIVEKIPHLKELGITAVELMPIHEFDSNDAAPGLSNYWGYSTIGFFALHHNYCVNGDAAAGIKEFRDMVKALHKAGIEVILDVVFNHTAEGNEDGPTLSFRGLDNEIYYLLDKDDQSKYGNYTGCGNTFDANHPVVGRLIIESLRYWVKEMHVDGFRFDLAAALARDYFGNPMPFPPILWAIESDPILAGTKLIAEAWDAAGLYKVGWFINVSQWYAEWNGPFRDDLRRFSRGDNNTVSALATRISGSSDIYHKADRDSNRSINFVTCHDGFTLRDLVSYDRKHNQANGENNADGNNSNYSWNSGVEGETDDPAIKELRLRRMKNLIALLFLSQGTPMILMGDECGRTQKGNNNAYCHNNEITWFNWDLLKDYEDLFSFVKQMIAFTQSLDIFRQQKILADYPLTEQANIAWHGVKLEQADWSENSHSLAFTITDKAAGERLHVIANAYWDTIDFEIPKPELSNHWNLIFDTSQKTRAAGTNAPLLKNSFYKVSPRSVAVLYEGQKKF
ncbi:MAG: glycogen debranching protein GlgX, partial [Candidatus Obscuribacterales bacterium]|nr:glycogen debranching protein GlgX [Candidatus Obscuribacterales bacterium]